MKKISLLLLLLTSLLIDAQNLTYFEAEYDIYYNTDVPNTRKSILQIDVPNKHSIFHIAKSSLKSGLQPSEDKTNINIITKSEKTFVEIDFNNKTILSKEVIRSKPYYIEDSVLDFNWDLTHTEQKKIGDLQCKKATTTFRGRNYIAWYAPSIPLSYGPYKFHGLPGLIVSITDDTNRYTWVIASYKTNAENPQFEKNEKLKPLIDLKKYVELRYKTSTSINSSRLPRGFQSVKNKNPRKGIEIKFPWEE